MEQAQAEYLSRVDEACSGMTEQFAKQEEAITERQDALDRKIDGVLTLLSKDRTKDIANQCRQLKRSTNTKFIILLVGMACIMAALILVYMK